MLGEFWRLPSRLPLCLGQRLLDKRPVQAYDNLNRLSESDDGNLNSSKTAIAAGSFPSNTGYSLDTVGNQTAHSVAEDASADSAAPDRTSKSSTTLILVETANIGKGAGPKRAQTRGYR